MRKIIGLAVFLLALFGAGRAGWAAGAQVPGDLTDWRQWVLHGEEERLYCVPQFD